MSIRANFKSYHTYITDSLYQWDINQELVITGLNLEHAPEIHFYNANMERAVVRQAIYDNGVATVIIPNALLQEALTIKADVCIYEDDIRKTIENIEIPVIAKARPLDYVFEDDGGEIYSYNYLAKKADALIDEFGRIIAEMPSIPDRVTEIENTTARITSKIYLGNGTKEAIIPYAKIPKVIIVSEKGTVNKYGVNFTFNYGTSTLAILAYYGGTTANVTSTMWAVSWTDNNVILTRTDSELGSSPFNHENVEYIVTMLY